MQPALLAFSAGACVALQMMLNGRLRFALGSPLLAAAVNNLVGLLGLLVAFCVVGASTPGIAAVRSVPPAAWGAGLLGAAFVATMVEVGPKIGLGAAFALAQAGQLVVGLLLDQAGLTGSTARPLSMQVIFGAGLLLVGAALLQSQR
jgi:transporter family-2 protein